MQDSARAHVSHNMLPETKTCTHCTLNVRWKVQCVMLICCQLPEKGQGCQHLLRTLEPPVSGLCAQEWVEPRSDLYLHYVHLQNRSNCTCRSKHTRGHCRSGVYSPHHVARHLLLLF